jgi:hypothetical protein
VFVELRNVLANFKNSNVMNITMTFRPLVEELEKAAKKQGPESIRLKE